MFYIHEEDLAKIYPVVVDIIKSLSSGMKRVEQEVTVGEDLPVFKVTGYWVMGTIRIDIRTIGR